MISLTFACALLAAKTIQTKLAISPILSFGVLEFTIVLLQLLLDIFKNGKVLWMWLLREVAIFCFKKYLLVLVAFVVLGFFNLNIVYVCYWHGINWF